MDLQLERPIPLFHGPLEGHARRVLIWCGRPSSAINCLWCVLENQGSSSSRRVTLELLLGVVRAGLGVAVNI
jgi:hypothetical protein